ncbi:hypothetical protein [Lachnotalea sp. AF33-28]|uniref:hypothetical protein n=1 Tax=Lachnotalea sp. AF33-28 TaxID=2292046 RepID=UPI000E4BF3A1|nr:hypothetical protein [Lachnotalea sp. AF33-28]RHP33570.1 hypothetical protein DWZ56_10150 [Lachnotalea sp. AF33-28]
MSLTFCELSDMYSEIFHRFQKIELKEWKGEAATLELMKQCGELAKWVMMKEKYYAFTEDIKTINSRLENELADVMAQLFRIAYIYNIDLEKAYIDARKEEDLYLKSRNV